MNELLISVRKWFMVAVTICALAAMAFYGWASFQLGGKTEQVNAAKDETKAVKKAVAKSNAKVSADLARAAEAGQGRERDRLHIDDFFDQLAKEAAHAPSAAADLYVLPDDRLRLWRDANAGRFTDGATGGQPDGSSEGASPAQIGSDHRAGSEPSSDSQGLSPARVAGVPAADLPATSNGGL